jgi:predicted dehydrogenase
VMPDQHRRHNPIVQRAQQLISEGQLGSILTAVALATYFKPPAYFAPAWRREAGAGPVLVNLIHDVDMLCFLLGEVKAAHGVASGAVRQFAVEDTAVALLEFTCGTLATLAVSDTVVAPWNWDLCAGEQPQYPRQPVQSHLFMGTQASLSLPDLSLWTYPGEKHWHQELERRQRTVHEGNPFDAQLDHFLAVIESRQQPLCSARDGLRTLAATLAIMEAARTGTRVTCEQQDRPPCG